MLEKTIYLISQIARMEESSLHSRYYSRKPVSTTEVACSRSYLKIVVNIIKNLRCNIHVFNLRKTLPDNLTYSFAPEYFLKLNILTSVGLKYVSPSSVIPWYRSSRLLRNRLVSFFEKLKHFFHVNVYIERTATNISRTYNARF